MKKAYKILKNKQLCYTENQDLKVKINKTIQFYFTIHHKT